MLKQSGEIRPKGLAGIRKQITATPQAGGFNGYDKSIELYDGLLRKDKESGSKSSWEMSITSRGRYFELMYFFNFLRA